MSLQTWKEEFYPIAADVEMSDKEAIIHSVRKWEGLTVENLHKHQLTRIGSILSSEGGNYITIGVSTCALCVKHNNPEKGKCCAGCPIYMMKQENCDREYLQWINTNNPNDMIEMLGKTLEWHSGNKDQSQVDYGTP